MSPSAIQLASALFQPVFISYHIISYYFLHYISLGYRSLYHHQFTSDLFGTLSIVVRWSSSAPSERNQILSLYSNTNAEGLPSLWELHLPTPQGFQVPRGGWRASCGSCSNRIYRDGNNWNLVLCPRISRHLWLLSFLLIKTTSTQQIWIMIIWLSSLPFPL